MNIKKVKTHDEIAQAYKSEPWWYDLRGFFILKLSYRAGLFEQVRFFGGNLGPKHLEVAIGSGTFFDLILGYRKLKRLGRIDVTGIDYAQSMLAGAIKRFSGKIDIELFLVDVAQMNFRSDSFDSINIANAIHCFPDVDGALQQAYRVLKPGGKLAANVLLYPRSGGKFFKNIAQRINDWGMRKGILFTPYEKEDIRQRFLKTGFTIDLEEIRGNCFNLVLRKPVFS